jgi:hypothetical protein
MKTKKEMERERGRNPIRDYLCIKEIVHIIANVHGMVFDKGICNEGSQ